MIKYVCDLCKKEMLHKESRYIEFKDAKNFNLGRFEICQRCFEEISAMVQTIPGRDNRCL